MPLQPPKSIVLLGALDTKGPELAFVCDALVRHGCRGPLPGGEKLIALRRREQLELRDGRVGAPDRLAE